VRDSLIVLVLGTIAVITPITAFVYTRQVHERDVAAISRLRDELDSARARLAAATTEADSSRLLEEVRTREYYVDRRQFH
jgi:hypothetical protein